MAAQIAPDRHVRMAGPEPTAEEAKASLADYVAYFGTYTIDERAGTITHHRQGNVQPGDRPDLVRSYEFVGDRLILRPAGHQAGGGVGAVQVSALQARPAGTAREMGALPALRPSAHERPKWEKRRWMC